MFLILQGKKRKKKEKTTKMPRNNNQPNTCISQPVKTDPFEFVSQTRQRERAKALGLGMSCQTSQRAALRDPPAKRESKLVTYIGDKLVMHHKHESVIKTFPGTEAIDAQCARRGVHSKTATLGEFTFYI